MTKTLITGAASGIGLALAQRLNREGHELVLVDLRAGDPQLGEWHAGDVTDEAFWDSLAPALRDLDFAAVNAGVAGAGAIPELDLAEWRRVVGINLDGAFLTLRAAMRAIEGEGAIVLTASMSGIKAEPGIAAYGASKAGVIQLMRVAAKESAPRGLRVNAIAPGGVDTPIWDEMPFFQDLIGQEGIRDGQDGDPARPLRQCGRNRGADRFPSVRRRGKRHRSGTGRRWRLFALVSLPCRW
jgi:NAD(P)-dependent dehydrogenase (short-subunit alcohol dehydrogenase family)